MGTRGNRPTLLEKQTTVPRARLSYRTKLNLGRTSTCLLKTNFSGELPGGQRSVALAIRLQNAESQAGSCHLQHPTYKVGTW